jgi:DNA replication protein DnaC
MHLLKARLKEFKLAGIANSLEDRINYANEKSLSYVEFLELLCEDEENNRKGNSYNKRYTKAKFNAHKQLEDFDFSFQPSIDKRAINDVATCQYIKEKSNVIFIGNPGTGKSHLGISLGIKALLKNYKVLFTSVSEMLYQLHIAKADNSYYKKLALYLNPELLILDELGFKRLPQYSADDFFEVISKRYEKGSCIITTNKSFEQWADIFGDNILSSAILDRVIHRSVIFKISGPSFRATSLKNTEENVTKIG